ncbi:MAG: ATP-dependent helicase C-terminal domain-containing protein, partial [Bryobacteraceae bacterium]
DQGCAAAAVLSAAERVERTPDHAAPSDLLPLIEREWQPQTQRVHDRIRRAFPDARRTRLDEPGFLMSILAAFPDRLARRRQANEVLLASGGSALLAETSAVRDAAFLVAIDIEERRERGLPLIRLASAVEPDWLLDFFPKRVEARSGVEWNRTAEHVEAVSALLYDGLAIEESRGGLPDPDQAACLLAARAIEAGLERFVDREQLEEFRARLDFAAAHSTVPPLTDEALQSVLTALCRGRRSFAELAAAGLLDELKSRYRGQRLDEIAPERLRLPGGRSVKVRYVRNQPPSIASRLQDFFGMKDTPRLAGVPLVVQLLAPNHRPVQTTTDLAGFWERLYPQVRRELSRRYPRHAWPETP